MSLTARARGCKFSPMKREIFTALALGSCAAASNYGEGDIIKCAERKYWCERSSLRRANGRQEYLGPYRIAIDGKFVERERGLRIINEYEDGRLAAAERTVVADDIDPLIPRSVTRYYEWGAQTEKFEGGKFEMSAASCEYKHDILHFSGQEMEDNIRRNNGRFKCPPKP